MNNTMDTKKEKVTTFNDNYEVLRELGSGKTSKVFLCRELKDQTKLVAVKLFKSEYLNH